MSVMLLGGAQGRREACFKPRIEPLQVAPTYAFKFAVSASSRGVPSPTEAA